ncbi:MAG TPA: hypothetical protein VII01_10255 [Solirubrobacteraceae bacterium]
MPRPYKPEVELQGALDRGELSWAITCAAEVKRIDLQTALRFLPLVAVEKPEEYDAWALRWLARWASENGKATIEQAAEIAASLADLPSEPAMLDRLLTA